MTYREKIAIEHPDAIDSKKWGGVIGCPDDYGYQIDPSICRDWATSLNERCRKCWDRKIKEATSK